MTQVVLHYAHTFGICTFHFHYSTGSADSVGVLLKRGANVNLQDKIGVTALHLAARNG